MQSIVLTDPTPDSLLHSGCFERAMRHFVNDPRDTVFVRLLLGLAMLFFPLSVCLFIPGFFRWWLAPVYWGLVIRFAGPFVLLLHNHGHHALFRNDKDLLGVHLPRVIGWLLGQPPETYYAHHMGIHHANENLPADLSSTMYYQRDCWKDFLRYYLRFLGSQLKMLRYFRKRKKYRMGKSFLLGELTHLCLIGIAFLINWQAALVVFVVPFFAMRFALMAVNWAQHAFIDQEFPKNKYRSVTTCINSAFNHRCFNDGYHLNHHLQPGRHWTEMPQAFHETKETMRKENSIVFAQIDYLAVFFLLMLKKHRVLAHHFVQLEPLCEEEIVGLLQSRLIKFTPAQLAIWS